MKPANYAHTLCTWNLTHMTKIGNYMKDFKLVNDSHIKLNYYLVYWFWKKNWTINNREGNGTPLQYSCLENPMDRGAWKAAVHGVAEGWTWLSDFTFTFHFHALEKEMANPLQCPCLENPRDGGAWWAAVYGVTESRTWLKGLRSSNSSQVFLDFLLLHSSPL